ncbi:MAG: hypothetical protein ACRDOH_29135, partial [Streptosporangiaceae bacterium]
MIPADLGAELTRVIDAAIAAGDLSEAAASVSPAGTWRPAPSHGRASYATSLPFELAQAAGAAEPTLIAERLAEGLRGQDWIS